MSDWQPMSTAPRDGTRILLALDYGDGLGAEAAHWEPSPTMRAGDFGPFVWAVADHRIAERVAVAWMPLPELPEAVAPDSEA